MKAQAIFTKNWEARDQAREMGMPIPAAQIEIDDFYFRLSEVKYCHKNEEGNINVLIGADLWSLKWDENLYKLLIEELNGNNNLLP